MFCMLQPVVFLCTAHKSSIFFLWSVALCVLWLTLLSLYQRKPSELPSNVPSSGPSIVPSLIPSSLPSLQPTSIIPRSACDGIFSTSYSNNIPITYCCAASCEICGGIDCGDRGGDANNCCHSLIEENCSPNGVSVNCILESPSSSKWRIVNRDSDAM